MSLFKILSFLSNQFYSMFFYTCYNVVEVRGMTINDISTKPCYIEIYCNNILISKATGFQIHHIHKYLITNWHVVSGRNFITNECLDNYCAIPDKIIVTYKRFIDSGQRYINKRYK